MLERTLEEAKTHILELERDLAACLLHAEHMDEALASRDVIGQAKGIIMSATGKDADSAFAELVEMSQHLNEKLRLVAERIAAESHREPEQ
jgi:AmiR/NasT family two-component response regulator